jgi:LmbE family N-acetylglucosaminyl deacetylase
MPRNILVIAAHPDDEVLGVGGTIARSADEGHNVYILILGEGITSRFSTPDQADAVQISALHQKSRDVARLLGAKDVFLSKLPDNRFDTVPMLDVVKIIEGFITKLEPQIVYTQHGGDLNIDHVVTFRATLTATRPMKGTPVRRLYAYEVASSTEWAFSQFSPRFVPQVYNDISGTLEKKIQAMQTYEGEARAFPHPRSPEALRAAAIRYGSHVGLNAAEVFSLIREIN